MLFKDPVLTLKLIECLIVFQVSFDKTRSVFLLAKTSWIRKLTSSPGLPSLCHCFRWCQWGSGSRLARKNHVTISNSGLAVTKSAGPAAPTLITLAIFRCVHFLWRGGVLRKHTICTLVKLVRTIESDCRTFSLNIVGVVTYNTFWNIWVFP